MDRHQELVEFIAGLPLLSKDEVPAHDSCPICLLPFSDLLEDTADPDCGITKLEGCGHIFCRKDLSEWIRTMHGSCPACRDVFLDVTPFVEVDAESSDGGEYIPDDDDEDEDVDAFMNTDEMDMDELVSDDHLGSEAEVEDLQDVDLDHYRNWEWQEQDDMEWGLTDGESESSPSEGDMSWNDGDDNLVTIPDEVDIVLADDEGADSEAISHDDSGPK